MSDDEEEVGVTDGRELQALKEHESSNGFDQASSSQRKDKGVRYAALAEALDWQSCDLEGRAHETGLT